MRPDPVPSAGLQVGFQTVLLVVCLAVGGGLVHQGLKAVRERAYRFEYTETSSWAVEQLSYGQVQNHTLTVHGREAVIFGAGFIGIGVMMLAWAAGLGLSLLGRLGVTAPPRLIRAIGGVSLIMLASGCLALFPPWRPRTLPLYLVVAAFTLAVTLPIPAHVRKQVFPVIVGLVILVGMTGFPAFPIFAGIFVFIISGTNLLVMWPGLIARVERRQSRGR